LCGLPSRPVYALFAWLISHQRTVFFSQNKPATNNQPAVFFSQNKSAAAISHQPNEQAVSRLDFIEKPVIYTYRAVAVRSVGYDGNRSVYRENANPGCARFQVHRSEFSDMAPGMQTYVSLVMDR
jgi:hypothetical protein